MKSLYLKNKKFFRISKHKKSIFFFYLFTKKIKYEKPEDS